MACNCEKCGGKLKGLAHIGLCVLDMDKSKAFYQDTLGFELTDEATLPNGVKLAFLHIGSCLLELVYTPGREAREAGVVDHIAIEVEDIETVVCKLIEKGVKFLSDEIGEADIQGGIKNIFFTGPDGERLEFFEFLNR